eukprot:GHVP01031976.1.p1 GENE.GHVP01031976.1~~GHVP01031976.1.p1  ORF type:complete len:344 (-),score=43.20 GHVP01031976.1:688-1719(-)
MKPNSILLEQAQTVVIAWMVAAFVTGVGASILGILFRGIAFEFTAILLLLSISEAHSVRSQLAFLCIIQDQNRRLMAEYYGVLAPRRRQTLIILSCVRLLLFLGFTAMAVLRIISPIEIEFKTRMDGDIFLISISTLVLFVAVVIAIYLFRIAAILSSRTVMLLSMFVPTLIFACTVSIVVYSLEYNRMNSLVRSGQIAEEQVHVHVINDLLYDPVGSLVIGLETAIVAVLGIGYALCADSSKNEDIFGSSDLQPESRTPLRTPPHGDSQSTSTEPSLRAPVDRNFPSQSSTEPSASPEKRKVVGFTMKAKHSSPKHKSEAKNKKKRVTSKVEEELWRPSEQA